MKAFIKLIIPLLVFFISISFVGIAQNAFITQWKTNNPGVTDDYSIEIPLDDESLYDFEVHWGDGTSDIYEGLGTELTVEHTYADSGIYDVSIAGNFPKIYFGYTGDREKIIDILQWGDNEWNGFAEAFLGCTNLEVNAPDAPDLSNVTSLAAMFAYCESINQPIGDWDVSNVENMNSMFAGAISFNQPIGDWDVSGVTDLGYMFFGAFSFDQTIEAWNVSGVTTMREMFTGASSFNQPLAAWDVSNVTDMAIMFQYASNFNQPIGNWDVSNVTSFGQMFYEATAFNQPLNDWTLSNNVQLSHMFSAATAFNQPLDLWDVSGDTEIQGMFHGAISFNQPLDSWDVSSVNSLTNLFRGATSFDQSLASWDISNVQSMQNMLMNCGMSACNYDATLIAWAELTPQNFVQLGAQGREYTEAGAVARQTLIDDYNWIIEGDALVDDLPDFEVSAEVIGTNIIISATGGFGNYTYNWSGPNGFSSLDSSIVAPYNGIYTVIVSDGCEEWTESFEIVSVGINEHNDSVIQVFPNPASHNVEIYCDDHRAHFLRVYDTRGLLVTELPFTNTTTSLDLISFNSGVYLAWISDVDGQLLAFERIVVVQ